MKDKDPTDLFVVPSTVLGGAEKILRLLVLESISSGRRAVVIFLSGADASCWSESSKYEEVCVGAWTTKIGLALLPFIILRRGSVFARVFTSHVHVTSEICLLRRLGVLRVNFHIARESTVVGDRFFGLRRWEFSLLYRVYSGMELLICQTDYMKRRLVEFAPQLKPLNIHVLPNPIDFECVSSAAQEEVELECGLEGDYIASVGRLIPEKGFDVLIRAFAQIRSGKMSLVIVGDGVCRERLEKLVVEKGLDGRVHLVGFLANPYPILQGACLGVVSSRKEGFPNTLLEMMALCPRVVSTRCAGGIDALPGIEVCDADAVAELATAMERALTYDMNSRVPLMRGEILNRSPGDYFRTLEELCVNKLT